MTIGPGDEDPSVSSGFDTFYAHCGDRDGHIGVVEGEGAVGGSGVDAEEEEG